MKKKSLYLPFKSNFFKEQDPFQLVIIFFIIFFGTAIFFSVPTFYDYKKYNQQIEKTINKEFKINLHNLEDISFRFIPSPHLLIKKAELKINENEESSISSLKNIKVFISITDLYKDEIFKIEKIEVSKANLYLNKLSFKNFVSNLKKNIVNNFIIKRSTLFFKDANDDIILISKIKNFDYEIDFVNNKKTLDIDGNIFDSEFSLKYFIDYEFSNIQNISLEVKSPNINFENKLVEDSYSKNKSQQGSLKINFLNQKNIIKYNIEDYLISFKNEERKNDNFELNGSINFKPLDFVLDLDIKKTNLHNLENLLYLIYQNNNLRFQNLSGIVNFNLVNFDHKVIKKVSLKLKFEDSKLFADKKLIYLDNFAILEINDYKYLENADQILQMSIKLNILNKEKFNRFLFNFKKNRIMSDNLYFTYQYNASNENSFISQISDTNYLNSSEFYSFRNLQQLKNLLKDEKIFILD